MKKKIEKQTLILLLTTVLLLAGIGLGTKLTLDAIDEKANLAAIEQVAATKDAQLTQLQALNAQYGNLQNEYEASLAAIPTEPAEKDIIVLLQDAAAASGCDLLRLSFQDRASEDGLQRMDMTLNLSGTYESVADFALNLDQLDRYFRLDSFALSVGGSGEAMSATLDISAFHTT